MESKINFKPLRDYVICEWYTMTSEEKKAKNTIILLGNDKANHEEDMNGINEVLAVGPEVKNIKVGDWAMLANMEVPIINIDGVHCAAFKAHMLMGTFDEKPDTENCENPKDGTIIRTRKTEKKALAFKEKYKQ